MIQLRPYQRAGVARIAQMVGAGKRRVCVVMPTGAGKTVLACWIIQDALRKSKRILFLAHRRELIKQAFVKLVRAGVPPTDIGILMAGVPSKRRDPFQDTDTNDTVWHACARRDPTCMVQIGSIDTVRVREERPVAGLVFIDECHRALSPSYQKIRAAYTGAVHLGLTATPFRADGRGLGGAYDALACITTPSKLVEDGHLVHARAWTVPVNELPDLSRVKLRGGDYDSVQLEDAVDRIGLVGNIVEHWQRHGNGLRTVVFAAGVQHSRHIVDRFVAAGIRAEHLDGETPGDEREAILARLESGTTRVVSNCNVLCEGWDMPCVKCVVLARPTHSVGMFLQQAGRVLRPYGGLDAIILDHAGCILEHGFPTDDREFTLDDAPKRKRAKTETGETPGAKTCAVCFAIVPSKCADCPECGAVFPAVSRELEEQDGTLVEVLPADIRDKRAEWDRLCAVVKARGFDPGWASHQYKAKFGTWPPSSFNRPAKKSGAASVGPAAGARAYFYWLLSEAKKSGHPVASAFSKYKAKFGESPPREWTQKRA